jgi:hypothetical protein
MHCDSTNEAGPFCTNCGPVFIATPAPVVAQAKQSTISWAAVLLEVSAKVLLVSLVALLPATAAQQPNIQVVQPNIQYAQNFAGADVGAQINAAYAALPASGGQILVSKSATFHTHIAFTTPNKPVLLTGLPGDAVNLTYTGAGTAITFDYGMNHRMGHGLRDLTLTGPGYSTNTVGIDFGGNHGAEGIEFREFKIQSFGTNVKMGSHTWLAFFDHGMIRNGQTNVLLPSGLSDAGEQITFNHITFADAPYPHTNSVWVQGGGQEVVFTDCSFDQAQLRIGDGAGGANAAQVVVKGSHFENPNWAEPDATPYDYVTVDNNPGNLLRVSDCYFMQDATTNGPAEFMALNGGVTMITSTGMYTPYTMRNFAVLRNNAKVMEFGFYDLSSNITGQRYLKE